MALTIGTVPSEVITNEPEFSATTSLTEGASYQNLRVRATVYIGGETHAVAVLEQPKGLNNWDFTELLKDFVGKCNHAVGGSDGIISPTMGSELLTGWTEYASLFTTWTVSGREITRAISTSSDYAKSNDLGSAAIGDVYIVCVENDYVDNGTFPVLLAMSQVDNPLTSIDLNTGYSGLNAGKLYKNHIYIFCMPYADSTPFIYLGNQAGLEDFEGTFSIKKVSDFKNNPGVYFTIVFSEVYENSSDVTTTGAVRYSQSYLFVPVTVRPGEDFDDYLIDGATKKWLSRMEDGVGMYKFGEGFELRAFAVSVAPYLSIFVNTDYGNTIYNTYGAGWVMGILNDSIGNIDAQDTEVIMTIYSRNSAFTTGYYASSPIAISCDFKCYPDIKMLSFVGDLGEELIVFRGLHTLKGKAERSFILNRNRIRKTLNTYKSKSLALRTLYETKDIRLLLDELINTQQDVWMLDDNFTPGYREVTVITDEAMIEDRNELIESEIEVEYYE